MSEEQNDGTWSGLKKTIVGVAGTVVTAGGVWLTTLMGGGNEPAQPAAAQPVINLNVANNNTQNQSNGSGKTVIVKEKTVPAQPAAQPKTKKKEGDEFKEEAPKW